MAQAAEQIVAGVVLGERLAVTMYGAIHRAEFDGQRDLRGLVVDPRLLAESSFRIALTDAGAIAAAAALDHESIVPIAAVEFGGPDVVVVTRGVGRCVTAQDLITAARASRSQGGKLPVPVAAAIGRSAIEALAAAHRAQVVHGAVHPRSVLVGEDGGVRLGDFVVGRALTTAVAQGADASIWRGLAGYLAPELVVGEDPAPGADVFAAGALLFTMLSGDVPPGSLHATPAVERLVQRALDTDLTRRYRTAGDLLEDLLAAFEVDRWELADRSEVIRAAGLSRADTDLDEATEDLLASLASSEAAQVTPRRPRLGPRAAAPHASTLSESRLDALLADLDDSRERTAAGERPLTRDPIREGIAKQPRRPEAIAPRPRVPSLDDPDDDAPVPPGRDRDHGTPAVPPSAPTAPNESDEAAAMNALAGLEDPVRRASSAAAQAAGELEQAARRAMAEVTAQRPAARPAARPPAIDVPQDDDVPPVRLRSRALGFASLLVALGGAVGFYVIYENQRDATAAQRARDEQARKDAEQRTRDLVNAQADRGTIAVSSTPSEASVWLKLGRTNLDTMVLTSSQLHRLRIELPGYRPVDTEVVAASWEGSGQARKARVSVTLKALPVDRKTRRPVPVQLPALPPNLAEQTGFMAGEGPIRIETSPPGAEVWLLIGFASTGVSFPTVAGRDYELRVLADGYKPGYASITADEWRDPKGDPRMPIDLAKKQQTIEKHLDLQVDRAAAAPGVHPASPPGEKPRP